MSDLDEPGPNGLHQLNVSFRRREALARAIRTGRVADLPHAAMRPPLDVPAGTVIEERYRLDEIIGSGGFGGVFRGVDVLTGRAVAVKILDHFAPRVGRRMLQEIAILRRLDLPCTIGFLDEGDLDGRPFVVMPYVEGKRFPGDDVDRSWAQLGPRVLALAEALARVHAVGVLHRDLKPDNVLWTDGRPMLLDFGLAQAEQLLFDEDEDLAGSPAYLAPEQYLGDEPTERSDLYAFGTLLYETLSDRLPFEGTEAMDVITELLTQDPPPLVCDAPAAVTDLVLQLLAKDPTHRPRSAVDVVRLLRRHVPLPRGIPTPERAAAPEALESLFAGPEIIHRLRSDPAWILWRRTGGDPSVVQHSLGAWLRAGIATIDHEGLVEIHRDVVDRMLGGMPVDPCRGDGSGSDGLDAEHQTLWVVIDALAPWATDERLSRVLECDVRPLLEELSRRGLIAPHPAHSDAAGWLAVRTPPRPDGVHAHRLHALLVDVTPNDADEHLQHLVGAGRMDDVPVAALRIARARRAEGRHREAWIAARVGMSAERRMGLDGTESLVLATELALEASMASELEVVELEARRRGRVSIARLCRFALDLFRGMPNPNDLDDVDLREHPTLRDWPHILVGYLRSRMSTEDHERWFAEVEPHIDPYEARFQRSRLELRRERMREAASLCEESVPVGLRGPRAVSRRLNAAHWWLLSGRFDRARHLLEQTDEELRSMRSSGLAAFRFSLERGLRYRQGHPILPSASYVHALEHLRSPAFVMSNLLQEAFIAWRAGHIDTATRLCESILSKAAPHLLHHLAADAVMAVLRKRPDDTVLERSQHPEVAGYFAVQMWGAHMMAGGTLPQSLIPRVHSYAETSMYPVDAPMDWLSLSEITALLENDSAWIERADSR